MKRMNMLRSVGMAVLATVLISSLAFAKEPGRRTDEKSGRAMQRRDTRGERRPGGRELGFGFFLGDLNLSDEQKMLIQGKYREFQLASEKTNLKMRFAQQDLRAAMREEPLSQAKVDGLWSDIAELRQVQANAHIDRFLELKSILTEEQLATLQARESERRKLQNLKAEFNELLLASGESDTTKLQELQAKITEKELALEKERAEKRAAFKDDFAENRSGRRIRRVMN